MYGSLRSVVVEAWNKDAWVVLESNRVVWRVDETIEGGDENDDDNDLNKVVDDDDDDDDDDLDVVVVVVAAVVILVFVGLMLVVW